MGANAAAGGEGTNAAAAELATLEATVEELKASTRDICLRTLSVTLRGPGDARDTRTPAPPPS